MKESSERLHHAKQLVYDMEEQGLSILENIESNKEKIIDLQSKAQHTTEKLNYANVITKRMMSLFNRL